MHMLFSFTVNDARPSPDSVGLGPRLKSVTIPNPDLTLLYNVWLPSGMERASLPQPVSCYGTLVYLYWCGLAYPACMECVPASCVRYAAHVPVPGCLPMPVH